MGTEGEQQRQPERRANWAANGIPVGIRTSILFVVGLGGIVYLAVFAPKVDPLLLAVFMTMIGLPLVGVGGGSPSAPAAPQTPTPPTAVGPPAGPADPPAPVPPSPTAS